MEIRAILVQSGAVTDGVCVEVFIKSLDEVVLVSGGFILNFPTQGPNQRLNLSNVRLSAGEQTSLLFRIDREPNGNELLEIEYQIRYRGPSGPLREDEEALRYDLAKKAFVLT